MMAMNPPRRIGLRALGAAMLAALQWRLLLLWLLLMLLPATLVALPVWRVLGGLIDHSVHAGAWAQHFSALMFGDALLTLSNHTEWFGGVAILGFAATLLLSAFLDGMVIGSGRAGHVLGFGALLQGGLQQYGRMFRLMLWSALPYAAAVGVMSFALRVADRHADAAVLQSQADAAATTAHAIMLLAFVLAQAIVESARAAFIADAGLRSATRALWRGMAQLLRRPLRTLLFYAAVTVLGLALAGAAAVARLHTPAVGAGGFLLALLWSQLMVLSLGWMRISRLFALAEIGRALWARPG